MLSPEAIRQELAKRGINLTNQQVEDQIRANGIQSSGSSLQDAAMSAAQPLQEMGSLAYTNPFTGIPRLAADAGQDYIKRGEAEDEAKRASAETEQSRSRLASLRDRAQSLASNFRSNLPSYQRGLVDIAHKNSRQQLASKLQAQGEALNRRGLISGGLAEGAAAKAGAESKAQLAQTEKGIQDQLGRQADEFDAQAAGLGLNLAGVDSNAQESYYKNAIENMQRRNSAYGDLGSAFGNLAGRFAGRNAGGNSNDYDQYGFNSEIA